MSTLGTVSVGVAQCSVVLGDVERNATRVLEVLSAAVEDGLDLVVFPEAMLTGYICDANVLEEIAISKSHEVLQRIADFCRSKRIYAAVGLLERGQHAYHNASVLFGDHGIEAHYRKLHIPDLGADRFVRPGLGPSPVVNTRFGRIGLLICYDLRFSEYARALAMDGADIIAMSTNWPIGVDVPGDLLSRARAAENRVFLAVANRPDGEGGFQFRGRSQIVDPDGDWLVIGGREEALFRANIDVAKARDKRGLYSARRPESYGALQNDYAG